MDTKKCGDCKEVKSISDFGTHKRDKFQSICKECKNIRWHQSTLEGIEFLANIPVDGSRKDKSIYWGIEDEHTITKFIKKISHNQDTGCFEWTAATSEHGYGQFAIYNGSIKLAPVKAHRFAYALAYGFDALPSGNAECETNKLVINHLCHNRKCVNPKHLEVTTLLENNRYRRPSDA